LTNDAARRHLASFSPQSSVDRRLQATSVPDNCQCAIGVDPEDFRLPTRDEFQAAFNETVTSLIAIGAVDFITQVGSTAEVVEISCAAGVENRTSQLFIEAQGDPDKLNSDVVSAIEQTIKTTLDDLYSMSCDPEFRMVENVTFAGITLLSGGAGRRSLQFTPTSLTKPLQLNFQIVFSCRGCPTKPTLFGNDAGRRLQTPPSPFPSSYNRFLTEMQRNLQESGTCFCDVNTANDLRTPTLEEFIALFTINIQGLDFPIQLNALCVSESAPSPPPTTQAPKTNAPVTQPPTTPGPTMPSELGLACQALRNGQVYETDRKLEVTYVYEILTTDTADLDDA
jgi:preprotein translocase subunit Sss1